MYNNLNNNSYISSNSLNSVANSDLSAISIINALNNVDQISINTVADISANDISGTAIVNLLNNSDSTTTNLVVSNQINSVGDVSLNNVFNQNYQLSPYYYEHGRIDNVDIQKWDSLNNNDIINRSRHILDSTSNVAESHNLSNIFPNIINHQNHMLVNSAITSIEDDEASFDTTFNIPQVAQNLRRDPSQRVVLPNQVHDNIYDRLPNPNPGHPHIHHVQPFRNFVNNVAHYMLDPLT